MSQSTLPTLNREKAFNAAGIIMAALALSTILGFVREMVIAALLGLSYQVDAYLAARIIPMDLFEMLLVAFNLAFIPIFTRSLLSETPHKAWKMASTIFTAGIVICIVFSLLGILFAPYLISFIASGFSPLANKLSVSLMRCIFSGLIFFFIAKFFTAILHSYRSFTAPSFFGATANTIIILSVLLLVSTWGVSALALGCVLALFFNCLIQIPAFFPYFSKLKLSLDFSDASSKQMLTMMFFILMGSSMGRINEIISLNFASQLSSGSVAALNYSFKIVGLPVQLFALAMNIVIYPLMSEHAARGDLKRLNSVCSLGIRMILLGMLPSAVFLISLRIPVVRLLFERGAFDYSATFVTSEAMFFYSLGLPLLACLQVLFSCCFALQKTRPAILATVTGIIANVISCYMFQHYTHLAHKGIALATSISALLAFTVLFSYLYKKLGGLESKKILTSLVKTFFSCIFMAFIIIFIYVYMRSHFDLSVIYNRFLLVMLAFIAGATVLIFFVMLFRVEEAGVIVDIFKKKLGLVRREG
ncbi:MAG: putative peptidoglycan biosynthesis protein MurJ [bacterium ADurb.Bin363]|nr:MAG: putative peptidoglycan biosynthesis protein MurJ [bacterium ADurb.Bin363]